MVPVSALDKTSGLYVDMHINAFKVVSSREIGGGYFWVDFGGDERMRCVGSYRTFVSRLNAVLKGGGK